MKVSLVFPNPSSTSPQKSPALAILYVAERARQDGHDVLCFDERLHSKVEIEAGIRQAQVVGISTQTGEQLASALAFSAYARSQGKYRVMGGVHPTSCAAQLVEEGHADVIVMGEGEEVFARLLARMESDTPIDDLDGIALLSDRGVPQVNPRAKAIKGEDIVSPVSDLNMPFFVAANRTDDVTLPSSRGCVYRCRFCYNCSFNNSKWRAVPIPKWQEQVLRVHKETPIKWLQPVDDWMGVASRIMQIGSFLHDLGIQWKPSIRAHQIDDALAEFLSKHGCTTIAIGVESGSPEVLASIVQKDETQEDILHAAESLAKYNMQAMYSFITGFPGETRAQRNESFDFADKLYKIHKGHCLVSFYVYSAYPGTPLYEAALASGKPMPKTTKEWLAYSWSDAGTQEERNIYHIAGFNFQRGAWGKTRKNFPGVKRLAIKPFELLCQLRWKARYFDHFGTEYKAIQRLLKWASSTVVDTS